MASFSSDSLSASVTSLIHAKVMQRPDSTAIIWLPVPGKPVQIQSYAVVWSRAKTVARSLRKASASLQSQGCTIFPDQQTVGLMIDEGPLLPIAMLGILLARMIIVPLDPNEPVPRLRSIVDDAEPGIIIAQGEGAMAKVRALQGTSPPPAGNKPEAARKLLPLLLDASTLEAVPAAAAAAAAGGEAAVAAAATHAGSGDISHIYFTSGSTGQPKVTQSVGPHAGERRWQQLAWNPSPSFDAPCPTSAELPLCPLRTPSPQTHPPLCSPKVSPVMLICPPRPTHHHNTHTAPAPSPVSCSSDWRGARGWSESEMRMRKISIACSS